MFLQRVQPIFNEVKGKMRNKMKNIVKVWRSSTAFLLSAFSFLILVSCSQEEILPQETSALRFVVGDFPTFGEGTQTRAIGTQDEGKTAWADGDKILVHLYSQKFGAQAATLTFDAGSNTWESDDASLSYLENETPTITAVYAPDCEIKSDETIGLLEGKKYGEEEYIPAKTSIRGHILDIRFESGRTYSRLRIAAMPEATLTVTTEGFTPAGANNSSSESGEVPQAEGSVTYTLTADDKGNAYLYGTFAEEATVSVKQGEVTLKDYTFTADKNPNGTEHNKSYALDARPVIDGTLGGKATAEESDITALMEQLKAYVGNGITTIIVTGETPAIIDMDYYTNTAIGEAIYRLSGGDAGYDENNPYNGKIDLILRDVTEVRDYEVWGTHALNSIILPKVTKLGLEAFHNASFLRTITFGSVITEANETNAFAFFGVGDKVGGCDLILNCGQMNSEYVPDLNTNTWKFKYEYEFNSITLTHTGECDECKANQ